MKPLELISLILCLLVGCTAVHKIEAGAENEGRAIIAEAERIGYEIPQHIDPVIHAVESPAVLRVMSTVMTGARYAAMATNPAGQAELVHEAVSHFRSNVASALHDEANAGKAPQDVVNQVLSEVHADKADEWTGTTPMEAADTMGLT